MNTLKIGWSTKDITTDKPVNIPGQFHMRPSKGVMDSLQANALVIENGTDIAIFLSCDMVVIRSCLLDLVREKTARLNSEIPVEKILMNATHAHTGASHYFHGSPGNVNKENSSAAGTVPHPGIEIASSDEYREFLSDQCAQAVNEAYTSRKQGGIAFGYGYAVVAHSRRVIYFDDVSTRPGEVQNGYRVNGHGVMYGNTNDPNFSNYEAGADHFINFLFTYDGDNKLTGAIINVPCPSQNSEAEYYLSADYWHDIRAAIQKKYGPIHILSQCAAAGDLSPRILHYKKAQERRFKLKYEGTDFKGHNATELCARMDIAERVAAAFDEVIQWASKDILTDLPINHTVKTIQLSKRIITEDELEFCKREYAKIKDIPFKLEGDSPYALLRENSAMEAQRQRFTRIFDRYESQKTEPKLPMELHALRIGDVAFASNRFELYMDFMHRIQARSPFLQTFIIQLAGTPGPEGGTYLATTRGADNKGYSASMFCNIVSPEGGQELVEETLQALNELHVND